ncbi:hypothetical protein DFJ73DRAFT_882592 [Zopfochytrium polystomum]|nr:hypothetical protein DFJ73DRAFT_882592 [Zopfochytrium polystomum]
MLRPVRWVARRAMLRVAAAATSGSRSVAMVMVWPPPPPVNPSFSTRTISGGTTKWRLCVATLMRVAWYRR